jgi:hypothetical protein
VVASIFKVEIIHERRRWRFSQDLHGAISQRTAFFIVADMKT